MTPPDQTSRPQPGLVPDQIHASVADVPPQPSDALTPDFVTMFDREEVPFWRPGAADVLRGMGWKGLLVLPAIGFVVGAPLWLLFFPHGQTLTMTLIAQLSKPWLFAVGVVITLVLSSVRRVVAARPDDFCIHCGYSMKGHPDSATCPECGRPYIRALTSEFKKDPHFFSHRYRKLRSHPSAQILLAGPGPTGDDGTG